MLEAFPAAIGFTGLVFPHLLHAADGVSAYLHPMWMPPWVYPSYMIKRSLADVWPLVPVGSYFLNHLVGLVPLEYSLWI